MAQDTQQEQISKKRTVYSIAGMEAVQVRRDVEYRSASTGALTMDVYYPPAAKSATPAPAVVFVTGFTDAGAQRLLGCRFKDMGTYISWAQLVAASGLAGVVYTNTDPVADARAVIEYVRQNAVSLGMDANRIGVWSCSGNVPNALALLMASSPGYLKCAALCYGYTLDLDSMTHVADMSKQFGFTNPPAGKSVADLPREIPLLVARAGQDRTPGLNDALDRFVTHALARNLPITVVNYPEGPHAFDVFHDAERSREVIKQILAFLQLHLASGL